MPGWNSDMWEKYKVRDMAKISVLHLLSIVQDEHGDRAVLSAGEIARLSQTRYNSIRMLLHRRWNRRDWECKYRDGTVKTKKGMRLVEEVDCTSLQTNFKFGYRITATGKTFLEKAAEWHPYWSVAKERAIKALQIAHYESIRQNSMRFRWYEHVANRFFYIRAPFLQEDFIVQTGKMDGNYRICRSMDSAFTAASQLPIPPSKEFRILVARGIARVQKESQESARPVADNRPKLSVVSPPTANDTDHGKTV